MTTTEITSRATTTYVNAANLRTALQAALAVAKPADLPGLRYVQVVLDHNQIVVLATDRHVAYRGAIAAQGDPATGTLLLDVEAVREAIAALPAKGSQAADFYLDPANGSAAWACGGTQVALPTEPVSEAGFPNVARIFDDAVERNVAARGWFAVELPRMATAVAVCKAAKNTEPEFRFLDARGATAGGMMLATWGTYGYDPEHELLVMQSRGDHVAEWTDDAIFAARKG